MALSADVMELVGILNAEGFEVLAGELMSEIGSGREQPGDGPAVFAQDLQAREVGDQPPSRYPIEESRQLGYAIGLLQLRLAEPVLRLAEAEKIAGQIQAEQPPDGTAHVPAIQIEFVPVLEGDPPRMGRLVDPGERADAIKLQSILTRMADEAR